MVGTGERLPRSEEKEKHVYGIKQQLDGCRAAIMNPTEGEQEPGGQPFRAVQKAISTLPPCVCVLVWI